MSNYTEQRPWGSFTILDDQEFCKVKRIEVNPGGTLSLQSHEKRAETWTMVSGIGTITLNDSIADYSSGDTVLIKAGQKHRIENCTDVPAIFVEVQTGAYFGEDDIKRYEDIYGRA
jgi:mannose-6-phosphate isomerase